MILEKNLEKTQRKNSLFSKNSRIFEENKPIFQKSKDFTVFPFKGALYFTVTYY
jgi:hypothetical protein